MSKNQIAISSLAMDLKRVALGYYKGSRTTAERFVEEALKRTAEIPESEVKPYLQKHLQILPTILRQKDKGKLAEDALMYSTLFQNYALKYFWFQRPSINF